MRRSLLKLIGSTALIGLTVGTGLPSRAQTPPRIGVLMLHGKSPGNPADPNFSPLKTVLERAGMVVLLPDMPWSRNRFMDGNWDKGMAEIAAHVQALRGQGATHIVMIGHSLGSPAAMSFAARGGDVQALVLMAPGHAPLRFYTNPRNTAVRDSVDEARKLVAEGKGDSRERFNDINQGRQSPVVATARDFLTYFDPTSDAEMSVTAPRVPPQIPVFVAVGDQDPIFPVAREYFYDKLPANPKNKYLEVKATHLTTPQVAIDDALAWLKTVLAP